MNEKTTNLPQGLTQALELLVGVALAERLAITVRAHEGPALLEGLLAGHTALDDAQQLEVLASLGDALRGLGLQGFWGSLIQKK